MSGHADRVFLATLASITLIGPLAVHFYLPVIPAVRTAFGVSESLAQLTFSITLFVMAFATLIYGALSDRYGRRPVLMSGIALFLAGSVLSAVAGDITVLLAGRLIQAAGAAGTLMLARTIARDLFGPDGLVRALAYLTMAYTLGPMLAPALGGALVDGLGWRSVFWVALVAGAAVGLAAHRILRETLPAREAAVRRQSMPADFASLFRDPMFTAYVCQSGFTSGAFFTMASASAFLMTDYLGRPAAEFGVWFMMFPLGYWLGNLIAGRLGGRAAGPSMVLAGSMVLAATVVATAALMLAGVVNPWTIFVPGFFVTFAQGLALPNAQAGAMGAVPGLAGTAAGIGVFLQMFCGAAFAQMFGLLADGTPMPMVVTVSASATVAVIAGIVPFAIARRDARRATTEGG